jgi:hypothetical protein
MSAEFLDRARNDLGGRAHGARAGGELVSWLVELGFEALDELGGALLEARSDSNAGGFYEMRVHFVLAIVFTMKCKHRDPQHGALAGQMVAGRTYHCAATPEGVGERLHVRGMQLNSLRHLARSSEEHHTVAATGKLFERNRPIAVAEVRQQEVFASLRRPHLGA